MGMMKMKKWIIGLLKTPGELIGEKRVFLEFKEELVCVELINKLLQESLEIL